LKARRGFLYLADLEPRAGTKPRKTGPVLVIQTDLLNEAGHPSTWVLPCATRPTGENLLPSSCRLGSPATARSAK